MTLHISARLAWHMDGWNGQICKSPKSNTYCVGQYSFPGEMIAERRDLSWEEDHAGMPCTSLDKAPPCVYSINAFGADEIEAFAPPPDFFRDGTDIKRWSMPPSTIATWPYEEVYKDEVRNPKGTSPKYNPIKRREAVNEFFTQITPHQSLVFYYTNYSNPFSEHDQRFYVLVGVSRVKAIGQELTWANQSPEMHERYGPNVWLRNISSHYPDQGFHIPYHKYLDEPDIVDRILCIPENPRNFKYATRNFSDDSALSIIEQLNQILGALIELGDSSENWQVRQEWLASLMAELWVNRGIYPGLLRVLDYLKFKEAIPYVMEVISTSGEKEVKDELFAFIEGMVDHIDDLGLDITRTKAIRKRWLLLEPEQQNLLRDTLPLFDLRTEQISKIIERPNEVSIYSAHEEIAQNPFVISESYQGDNPDDQISFSQIDHGMYPSPDLGDVEKLDTDDWRRLRALCVEQLKRASQHTFLPAEQIIQGLNYKLSFLPEWKRTQFSSKYFEIEKEDLSNALTYRYDDKQLYLYLAQNFADERLVESTLRKLASTSDIKLRFPVKEGHWKAFLYDSDSEMAKLYPAEYQAAIDQQIDVCQKIFRKPSSVICGAAGTGKTTVVKAIIQAIVKGHGEGTSFQLLAPTGKAADRMRDRTGKEAATIHSFLARRGWLNRNMSLKPEGGSLEDGISTYIIDESSMLDLPLLATLFRAINWNAVQRLIFVGDPNQLPPIGVGKVFADLIDWLRLELPENIGELQTNLRQIHGQLAGQETGILDLASLYIHRRLVGEKSEDLDAKEDETLQRVQEGGDVAQDLRVLYWQDTDELERILVDTMVSDMERDTGMTFNPTRPDELWNESFRVFDDQMEPDSVQVISPYRGELFGIEHINLVLQAHKNRWMLDNKGNLGGITYRDKVIQVVNRPSSNPIWAYNTQTRKGEKVEIFNGEIGITKVHGFDHKKWKWSEFRLRQFQVVSMRKQHLWISYQSEREVEENLHMLFQSIRHRVVSLTEFILYSPNTKLGCSQESSSILE